MAGVRWCHRGRVTGRMSAWTRENTPNNFVSA
ncbi:hypothetical protein BKA25_005223 [Actinoalloteichus hymeniacidonis]|nr:hypothetical protein [Actinoalloteichus hymeniacidonis]